MALVAAVRKIGWGKTNGGRRNAVSRVFHSIQPFRISMKSFLILAALVATVTSAATAQTPRSTGGSGSAATRAGSSNGDSPSNSATTVAPNYSPGNGQRTGGKINTAPATGATRASRSSSTTKAARQGKATGSGNIETMSKNSNARPGPKK